jgi:hypothetical protein
MKKEEKKRKKGSLSRERDRKEEKEIRKKS